MRPHSFHPLIQINLATKIVSVSKECYIQLSRGGPRCQNIDYIAWTAPTGSRAPSKSSPRTMSRR